MIILSKIIFLLSILGIAFIIFRKLPALAHLPTESSIGKFSFKAIFIWPGKIIKQFISSNFFQGTILGNLEKSLRKLKILTLKIDNILGKFIRKFKKNSGE